MIGRDRVTWPPNFPHACVYLIDRFHSIHQTTRLLSFLLGKGIPNKSTNKYAIPQVVVEQRKEKKLKRREKINA